MVRQAGARKTNRFAIINIHKVMVIPLNARQIGITVRYMYACALALFVAFGISLAYSSTTSALLPVSDIPIVGQPVADTVNTVTGDVVEPVVDTVTDVLPEPVGQAVQAPVQAVTQAAAPIIGPSSSPENNIPHRIVSTILPQPIAPQAIAPPAVAAVATKPPVIKKASQEQPPHPSSPSETGTMPAMNSFLSSLFDNYIPVLIGGAKNFAALDRDASIFIAAIAILFAMGLLLARFVMTITRVNSRSTALYELTLMRRDLVQASMLVLSLLIIGASAIFLLLLGSGKL